MIEKLNNPNRKVNKGIFHPTNDEYNVLVDEANRLGEEVIILKKQINEGFAKYDKLIEDISKLNIDKEEVQTKKTKNKQQ